MHKSNSKTRQTKLYNFIRDIGFERIRIELIEDFPCTDKYELRQRENYWIREIGTLNLRNSFITEEDKVASRSSYNIQYCETNKDNIGGQAHAHCMHTMHTMHTFQNWQYH